MNVDKKPLDVLRFYPQIDQIKDAELRRIVIAIWEDLWAASAWKDMADLPVSGELPYPNLPHTQGVVEMALAMADAISRHHGVKINRDHLIAAAVLQDASKLVEYAPGPDGRALRTEIGKQYMHGFWCAHLGVAKGLPAEIGHVILTHSSSSAKFPDTLEGKILYFADQIDVVALHKDRWKKLLLIGKE
jgi:hypothetical protein